MAPEINSAQDQATTVRLPLPLGVPLWHAGYGRMEEWVPCPECLGTKEVKLTLASGEEYMLDCRCCQSGFDPPRGAVVRYSYQFKPRAFIALRWGTDGGHFWFAEESPDSPCYSRVDQDTLFTDRDECQARCEAINAERAKEDADLAIRNLMSKRKDLAWSVHYWRNQLAQRRHEVELIEKRLRECQERKRVKA